MTMASVAGRVVILRLGRQEGLVAAAEERWMLVDRHDYTAATFDERFANGILAFVDLLRQVVLGGTLTGFIVQMPRLKEKKL